MFPATKAVQTAEAASAASQAQVEALKVSLQQSTDKAFEYETQISNVKKDLDLLKLKEEHASKVNQQTESAVSISLSQKQAEVIELKAAISQKESSVSKLEAESAALKKEIEALKAKEDQGRNPSRAFLFSQTLSFVFVFQLFSSNKGCPEG